MKMETSVTAPCAGTVTTLAALSVGDPVDGGQIVAVIRPAAGAARAAAPLTADESWAPMLDKVAALQAIAHKRLAPGSNDPGVVRQRNRGKLTCRERIDVLLDPGSFREIGSLAGFATYDEEGDVADFTPANHVGGWGRIEGRAGIVCADDFTSRGGHADGAIGQKSRYLDRLSIELRAPSIRLLDGSSGGGSVATMVPKQDGAADSSGPGKLRRHQGRPAARGGRRRLVPARPSRQHLFHRAARHGAGGQPAAGQRRRHRRGQGGARPLLGDGARHRAAVRRRPAGGQPRHGLRHHQGGPRRLAHPLPQRLGRQPGRDRGGGDGADPALPLLPALQRLRGAAGRRRRPIPPTGARRSCSPSCRASAPPPSTCAAPSG